MPNNILTMGSNGSLKTVDQGFSDAYYTNAEDAATGMRLDVVGGLNASKAYQTVPWIFRGINMVASAISNFPFALANEAEDDLQEEPEYESIMRDFRRNLFMVAGSLYLTGAAYLWPDTNARGTNITLRFVRSKFLTPIVKAGRLVGFKYTDNDDQTIPREVGLDKIIYFWNPNFDSAVRPGPAEAVVALGAASLLYAMTSMEAAFFNGGGIPVTFIETPGAMNDGDKDKFQNFFNRSIAGIRNAFRYLVVRVGIKATVLGSNIKDTQAPELTATERDSVAVALGVPPSLLSGKVSDVMNSRADKFMFYDLTIAPLFGRIVEVLNEQLFNKFQVPVTLTAAPDELEVMQSSQLEQAQAVQLIVGKPLLTVDEGRELLGYEAMTPEQLEATAPPAPVVAQPVADDKQPASEQFEEMVASYADMRKKALTSIGRPVGAPFDAELAGCKSAGDVRKVFDKHWPIKTQAKTATDMHALLREAIDAAKALNAEPVETASPAAPAQVTVVNNMPRLKRQHSKIVRGVGDLTDGTETTFEYEP